MDDVILALDAANRIVGQFVRPPLGTRNGRWPIVSWPLDGKRLRLWNAQDGKCHLCGKPMLPEVSQHPHSATFDHLVPASQGGTRATSNLKLAHRHCNHARGNKPLGLLGGGAHD